MPREIEMAGVDSSPPDYNDLFPETTPSHLQPADVPALPSAPPESGTTTASGVTPDVLGDRPTRRGRRLPPIRSARPLPTAPIATDATPPGSATSGGATSTTAGSTTAPSTSSTTTTTLTSSSTSTSTRTTSAARSRATTTTRREYDYSKLDKYYCYCETFRCKPFSPPQEHPKKCELEKTGCIIVLVFLLIIFLFCVIFFPVYFAWPSCEHSCADSDSCIPPEQLCDGITQCKENDDEKDCEPKVTSMARYVVGILGSPIKIECTAVVGNDNIEWFHTDIATGVSTTIWNSDGDTLTGYEVYDYKDHYDLEINSLAESNANLTYGVRFSEGVRRSFVNVIVTDNFACTPSIATYVEEGEIINVTATVRYYGDNAPLVLWYSGSGNLLSSISDVFTDGDEHILSVTYSTEALASLNGVTYFAYMLEDFPRMSYDSQPALFTQTCYVTYYVLYAPRNIYIQYFSNSKDSIIIFGNEYIYCYGDGNPEPAYSWSCNSGRFTSGGFSFLVPYYAPSSMSCTCTIASTINGVNYTKSASITFETFKKSGFSGSVISLPLLVMTFFAKYL